MMNKKFEFATLILPSYLSTYLSLAICIIAALMTSILAPTFHLDGAFQTASGLFRLESGQLPGKDFYPYLGIGPLLGIFPIFKIFGGDLAAAVAAAKFVTMLLSWIAISILWLFILRPVSVIHSIAGGALILFGTNFLTSQLSLIDLLSFGLEPGNSLRPIRVAIPYLVALSIYFLIRRIANHNVRNFLISATLGFTLLWSNDFSIPTFGLFFLLIVFYLYLFNRNWVGNALLIAFSSILIYFLILSIVTAGQPFELLKYNFFDVANDQWWYFGPYGSHARIFEIIQIERLFSAENYFPLFILFAVFILALRARLIGYWLVFAIGLTLFAGGSLASIGGHLGGYFGGFYFWGVATSLIFCVKALVLLARRSDYINYFVSVSSIFGLLMICLILIVSFQGYKSKLMLTKSNPNLFYVDEFGSYLDIVFREYIDYARQNDGLIVVEDYWGLWNSLNRRFPPMPVDSVIHALGNVREISRGSLKYADLLITTRYSMSPQWQPWNLSQNYWFYDDLISNWEPIFTSPTTIVWKRSLIRSAFERVICQISDDKSIITIPQSPTGFYRLTLGYESVTESGRHLLMFKNNISFGGDAEGFLSLQPGKHVSTFPVFLENDVTDVFNLKVVGKAQAEITSCVADRILYKNDELLRVKNTEDFFLTDQNWFNGVARNWAGFFTHNTVENRAKFKKGKAVVFRNGEKRSIITVVQNGLYLNVWVDGEILIQKDVGLPTRFEVTQ